MEQVYRMAGPQCVEGTSGRFRHSRVQHAGIVQRISNLMLTWQDRATQRAQLAALDDRLLRDMGIDPVDAMREADKPFWRA
jgi:uncharacterized protein YjiS (DUF1127 family)